jgi:hypothetical protein
MPLTAACNQSFQSTGALAKAVVFPQRRRLYIFRAARAHNRRGAVICSLILKYTIPLAQLCAGTAAYNRAARALPGALILSTLVSHTILDVWCIQMWWIRIIRIAQEFYSFD